MSRYEYKATKTRREKIGFYTAFSICLIAVCMAVYSTYTQVAESNKPVTASVTPTSAVAVAQPVTHVTVPTPTLGLTPITEDTPSTEEETAEAATQPTTQAASEQGRADALQTMLAAEISLSMPTKSGHVLVPYSTDSVYNKTLNSWKPHLAADFDGELGEDILAMLSGEVSSVSEDKMYGKTVDVTSGNVVISYCGLGEVKVKQGDKLSRGDKIAVLGTVPCEASDPNHIHVTVKINGATADPLTFVNNEN